MQRTVTGIDIAGKRVLMRVDFNVPLKDGKIANDQRIRAALPTIEHCIQQSAKLVLMTHVGSSKGERKPELSTGHLVHRLRELLPEVNCNGSKEIVGDAVMKRIGEMASGEVLLLENLRFDAGEKQADEGFARQLRELGDVYANDAFAACHRKHASTYAVPQLFPENARAVGLLEQRSDEELDKIDHRLFSRVSRALRGVIFRSIETIRDAVAKTTTGTGLKVKVSMMKRIYQRGVQASEAFLMGNFILRDDYLPKYNYTTIHYT